MEKALQRRAVLGHSNATLSRSGRHPSCIDFERSISYDRTRRERLHASLGNRSGVRPELPARPHAALRPARSHRRRGVAYHTINAVLGLYDDATSRSRATQILRERTTDAMAGPTDAMAGLSEASEGLDRYVRNGEAWDLSRHDVGRMGLKSALSTIAHERNSAG